MKFTKEEINLCKQVAERHREEINEGDWYHEPTDNSIRLCKDNLSFLQEAVSQRKFGVTPLWTISDCLEFLNQRDAHCVLLGWTGKTKRSKRYCHVYIANNIHEGEGYTYLETLLIPVLAVLGEETASK